MWLVVSIERCFLGEPVADDQEATLRMACCVSSACRIRMLLSGVSHTALEGVPSAKTWLVLLRALVLLLLKAKKLNIWRGAKLPLTCAVVSH